MARARMMGYAPEPIASTETAADRDRRKKKRKQERQSRKKNRKKVTRRERVKRAASRQGRRESAAYRRCGSETTFRSGHGWRIQRR
jgi:hypothetical protein